MPSLKELVMEMLAGRGHNPEAVDIDFDQLLDPAAEAASATAAREGMWKESSFDLQNGLEVSEEPMDTMPDELIDVFLKH